MKIAALVLVAIAVLGVGGCTQAQVERAERAAASAQAILAQAEEARAVAVEAVKTARAVAEATQSEQAVAVVAKAEHALQIAEAALPTAQAAADATAAALKAAREAQERGASTWDIVLAVAGSLLGGAGGAGVLAARAITGYRTALRLTAKHAERMELAPDDHAVALAKQLSMSEQAAAGVHPLIQRARGKT